MEGIDLYHRSRLGGEDVTNVKSLVHHDLIDLILATRIPVPHPVDWVDQAILYLHLSEEGKVDEKSVQIPKTLHRLRETGIRTVTDLEKVLEQYKTQTAALVKFLDESESKRPRIARRHLHGSRSSM